MHNPTNPVRTIELDGLTYRLHFEHGDFAGAEPGLGHALVGADGVEQFWQKAGRMPAHAVAALLYVGLQRAIDGEEYPTPQPERGKKVNPVLGMSFRQVRRLITFENDAYVFEAVWGACQEALPKPKAEPQDEPKAEVADADPLAPTTTGSAPGPSPE